MPAETIPAAAPAPVRELLAFMLGREAYGIDIRAVREIRAYGGVTAIAGAPAHLKGVINLRGEIVPVVDLRLKFGAGEAGFTPFTLLVVVEAGRRTAGLVVDVVSDVLAVPAGAIRPAPEVAAAFDRGSVVGLATLEAHMLVVLDVARLLASPEMGLVEAAAA